MEVGGATAIQREVVEACLDRITASRPFSRSRRLGRFLRYSVEAVLDGRPGDLKERTIGVEVYGRREAYDPRTDAIVRSEAHRLRWRLAAYYAREGRADPIVITVPKGSYVPELRSSKAPPEDADCRLLVADFEACRGGPDAASVRVLGEALRRHLAAWPRLEVLDPVPSTRVQPSARARPQAEYRVEGSVDRGGRHVAVTVRLVRLADGHRIWSETERFARNRKRVGEFEEAVAGHFATAIAATLRRPGSARPAGGRAMGSYAKGRYSAIRYGNTLDLRDLEAAERRLEAAVEQDAEDVDALAELAHVNLLRLYPPRREAAQVLAAARAFLERALARQPRHARSLYLLGHVEGSAQRPREGLRLTESAVAIDPDDPEGRTMLAVRYASLGFWESAVVACDWAVSLDPVWEAPYRIKAYLLTRMQQLDAARLLVDDMARRGLSPLEISMARFDLRLAEGDFSGARAALESEESMFSLRRDLWDRRDLARALAEALGGRYPDARRTLDAHRGDGPRFWDHTIRLALALGEEELALDLLVENPINRSYRWLVTDALVQPCLGRPRWRALAAELHASWQRDLEEVGPRLPAPPPALPAPAVLLRGDTRSAGAERGCPLLLTPASACMQSARTRRERCRLASARDRVARHRPQESSAG